MKPSVKLYLVLGIIAVPLIYIMYLNLSNLFSFNESRIKKAFYRDVEDILFRFVETHFLTQKGDIYSYIGPEGKDTDTLSESVGMLLDYCAARGRKDLFDREFLFLKGRLLVKDRFIRWKTGKKEATCNAAVDDFRILRALLEGYEKWKVKDYIETAGLIAQAIYDNQVVGRNLCELYDWVDRSVKKSIPLCYLDLYTMNRLSVFNRNWKIVADNGMNNIASGRIGGTLPLFYKYLDYGTGLYHIDEEYVLGKGICITYSLLTALHMAEVRQDTGYFSSWLRNEAKRGKLYGWYDPDTLEPSRDIENAAVYALASIYAAKLGDNVLCWKLLDNMLKFMVTDKKSPNYGGFGNDATGEFYSFDNLTALLALKAAAGD